MLTVIDCPMCGMAFGAGAGGGAGGGFAVANSLSTGSSTNLKQIEHVRSIFPETWLWQNSTTGYKFLE